ncbi:MAG: response regulator [Magnetococcus sp. YQC-3]
MAKPTALQERPFRGEIRLYSTHHVHLLPANTPDQAQPMNGEATILLVDDQVIDLKTMLAMLTKLGCDRSRCDTAMDGQQAVELFKQKHFDLVFMNYQMPIMSGIRATTLIREWERQQGTPPVPIIAFTSHDTPLYQKEMRSAGMNGFLHKPATLDDLGRILQRLQREDAATIAIQVVQPGIPTTKRQKG